MNYRLPPSSRETLRNKMRYWVVPFLLLANVLVRMIVAFRQLQFIDGLTIPDDAYLCLTISRNIARGLGPFYGTDFTNGFQPLYVFMMAPAFLLFPDNLVAPIRIALSLLTAFDTFSLFVLIKLLSERCRFQVVPVVVAGAWIFNPYIIKTTLNGMETSISFFFMILTFYFFYKYRENISDWKKAAILGIVLGLAILARIDNIFLAIALALMIVVLKPPRTFLSLRSIAALGLGALLVTLPWILYSYHYTGDIYPISGKASRYMTLAMLERSFGEPFYLSLDLAAKTLARNNQVMLLAVVILVGFLLFVKGANCWKNTLEELLYYQPLFLYAVLLFVAYTMHILTFWYYDRYFFPILIVFLVTFAFLFDVSFESLERSRVRGVAAAVLVTWMIFGNVLSSRFQSLLISKDTTSLGYMNLGVWARNHFKDGTVIGSSQSGALSYFADNLTVINLDGVVNKKCYQSFLEKRNIEYIRAQKIEYVIGSGNNIEFMVRQSRNFTEQDTIQLGRINGFTSWYTPWNLVKIRYIDDATLR